MKKNYLNFTKASLALSFMALFGATGVKAQVLVAGSVTGTTPVNYTSLSSAFTAINAGTHTGAITVSITANVTEPTTPTALLASGGSSSYGSILIRPAGGSFTVNSSATPLANRGIIELAGADNVTIDGDDPATPGLQNLSIVSTVTTAAGVANIRLASNSATGADGANNITVKNCIIKGSRDAATSVVLSYGIQFYDASAGAASTSTMGANSSTNTVIQGNVITRCAHGIHAIGNSTTYLNSGLTITSNTIGSTTATDVVSFRGIDVSYTDFNAASNTATIGQNDITFGNTGAANPVMGIELGNANAGIRIARNNIHDVTASPVGAYGIALTDAISSSNGIVIRNNFIRDIRGLATASTAANQASGLGGVGIMVTNTVTGLIINNNTIAQLASGALGSCVQLNTTGATIAQFRNNALVNNIASTVATCFYCTNTLSIVGGTLNNNDYFANAGAKVAFFNNAYLSPLSSFTAATGMDANSYTVFPNFVSATDLHIVSGQFSFLESTGASTAITGVATDYDNDVRPGPFGSVYGGAQNPDIGADEFDGLIATCISPTVTATAAPTGTICAGTSVSLTTSGATSYTWSAGSTTNSIGNATIIVVTPTVTTSYTVLGTTSGCTGVNSITIVVDRTVAAVSSATAVCLGGTVSITASGATSYTLTSPITGTFANGAALSPTVSGTYTVAGLNTCGTTTATLSIVVSGAPSLTVSSTSTNNICSGTSVTLTASGPSTTYTWTQGTSTNVISSSSVVVVTPSTITTYSVAGTNPGCSASTKTITVNADNTVAAVPSVTAVCLGNSVSITASGATAYTLTSPTGTIANGAAFSPTATNTYTVAGVNTCGTTTIALTITVSPVPSLTVAANPTGTICNGTSVTLTANGPSTTYTWTQTGSTVAISSASSVVVTPSITTNYTVSGTNLGCSASVKTISIVVDNTVTAISSASVICLGGTVSVSGVGSTTGYTVTTPTGTVANGAAFSPTTTNTYTVATNNACGSSSTAITVTVNAVPSLTVVANPSVSICSGSSATLTASGPSTTYTWTQSTSTSVVSSASSAIVSPTINTTYTVSGTSAACSASTKTITVLVDYTPTLNAVASATAICLNRTVSITASGANTYTLTSPSGTIANASAFTPTGTSNYTVVGANACGTPSTVVSITVNPLPTLTISVTTPTLCSGASIVLSVNGSGTSYTWAVNGSTNTAITITPAISTGTSTTINYTATASSALGCTASAVNIVTVIATPVISPLASPPGICTGGTAALILSGSTTYTWFPMNVNTASLIVTPTVVASTITVVHYTVTSANGGVCASTKTVDLIVNPLPTLSSFASSNSVCAGSQATLTGGGALSYTWTSPTGTFGTNASTVLITPTVTTTYTFAGNNGTCTSVSQLSLAVNPIPTLGIVSLPTSLCTGSVATLTGSGGINYTWVANGTTTVGTTNPINVNPTVTTAYTLIGDNSFSCTATAGMVLFVNSLPTLNITPINTLICLGRTINLTASSGNAQTYTWTGGQNPANTPTYQVSPSVTSTYTVLVTNGTTSCTAFKVATVSVFNPSFTVPSPTAICKGTGIILAANGAVSYTWLPGNLTPSGTQSLSPSTSTTYTINGTGQTVNGSSLLSCQASYTTSITVNPNPTVTAMASKTLICRQETAVLTATGATTYVWHPTPASGTGSNVVVNSTDFPNYINSVTYTVIGTDTHNCKDTKTLTVITSGCVGIDEQTAFNNNVLVYPNPNNGEFTIKSEQNITLHLMNELGQQIRTISLNESNNRNAMISDVANGIYFIIGSNENGRVSQKVVITK